MQMHSRRRPYFLANLACLFSVIGVVLSAIPATTVRAEISLLNADQMKSLFRGGIEYSTEGNLSTLTFTFRDDGVWSVVTDSDEESWGDWRLQDRKVCREETGKSVGWKGLNKKSLCFGVWKDGSALFIGRKKKPATLVDPSVLARLQDAAPPPPAVMAKNANAKAARLNHDQLTAFFRGGIEYSIEGSKTILTFTFRDDGTWSVRTGLGGTSWGNWNIVKNTVCRNETGKKGKWNGLRDKSPCFGFLKAGSKIFFGKNKILATLIEPRVLARLDGEKPRPEPAQTSAQMDLAKQKHEIEVQRLALERQRLTEEMMLSKMRLELEREKLNQERRSLSIKNEGAVPVTRKRVIPDIAFGAYHAIVIGINDYKFLPKLKTAVVDARAIARMLIDSYGFTVHLLENPTRADVIDKFDELRSTLVEDDNLLIYYAGHGWLDEQSGRGYWLPVNARTDRRSRWLSNADLTDALQALFAKHVMIVADSCYSGTLTRSIKVPDRNPSYIQRIAEKRARVVLSSGGLEPVADSGGGEHSVFAAQFLKALRSNEAVLDGTQLFEKVRQTVVLNADQTPEYSDIRKAGHEGGDFLFVRKN